MISRQLFDHVSSTYSYLLADERSRQAVLIDSVFEQHARDAALIRELELDLRYVLDTHCHADHVTGAWLMKQAFGSSIALSGSYDAQHVDLPLAHGMLVRFGEHALEVRATPGHTAGCLSLVSDSRDRVFSGDALLVRGAGRTDFQQGDAALLFRSIREQLFVLPDDCLVLPAHDYDGRTASTIGEERRFNPRIGGGAREEDFVGYMHNLGLPHPKQLAVALPANLRSGRPEQDPEATLVPWAPLLRTYAGLLEVAPEWLAEHREDVLVLDVRSAAEFDGELGHIPSARLVPLDELRSRMHELPRDRPIVVVCQTGRRSGMATLMLSKAGIAQSASLSGGMVRWRELGLLE
jgi:glyoxylase-like metal-dependent hydrolase (beta-lactamase superfamily II)/rhodanese-related sulfurtransferase